MKHKRQTLSKTDDEESKDEFKGESESQSSSEFSVSKPKKSKSKNFSINLFGFLKYNEMHQLSWVFTIFLIFQIQKNRALAANCLQMTFRTRLQIHEVKITIHRVQLIITQVKKLQLYLCSQLLIIKSVFPPGVTPNSTVEFSQASSNGVNIISADSSVVSSLDDDDEPPPPPPPPVSTKTTKAARNSDEISIKREVGPATKSPFSSKLQLEREVAASTTTPTFFPNQSPNHHQSIKQTTGGYFSNRMHPSLKVAKFGGANNPAFSAQNEYLNNYYRHQQEFGGKVDASYADLHKIVGRPQGGMQFGNQHHKGESKFSFFLV